ncbi:MAG: WD40 repeat domain-containing protein [Bryobacteraceae bacterium]
MNKTPEWSHPLSATPLPGTASGKAAADDYMVNSVAISADGSRIVAGTYYYPFDGTQRMRTDGTFGTYCYGSNGIRHWADEFAGDEGVYSVAISADAKIAVAGGLRQGGKYGRSRPTLAFLRAYDVATGKVLLDFRDPQFNTVVDSVAVSDNGGVIAAGTKTSLYIYSVNNGAFPATPAVPFGVTKAIESVAVAPDGSWFAACGKNGNVYTGAVKPGAVNDPVVWTEPAHTHFVSIAIARSGNQFVVAGGNVVYLFDRNSVANGYRARYELPASSGTSIRFVSISTDGTLVTAVANAGEAGILFALTVGANTLSLAWSFPSTHNPNSTTMDKAARYFTLADGYPDDVPGSFSLFKETGKVWEYTTTKMNWPMVISADGSAIAAGGDDNKLYFFVP